jgi:hypothetical protein
LRLFHPTYEHRKDWGHTVRLAQPEFVATDFGTTVDPDELEEVILWATENSQARRISYDTWQFRSQAEAKQFIMLYKLRWGP